MEPFFREYIVHILRSVIEGIDFSQVVELIDELDTPESRALTDDELIDIHDLVRDVAENIEKAV